MRRARRTGQRGATLIIALIMLVALAMLSAWAFNGSQMNMRVVGNSQTRQEAVAAAQAAIELTISSPAFAVDPVAVAASAIPIDIDGDSNPDYQVQLTPAQQAELERSVAGDRACLGSSAAPNPGIVTTGSAPPTGDSLCADSEWNLRGVVTDPRTNASAAVNQGVAIRSLSTDATNACP